MNNAITPPPPSTRAALPAFAPYRAFAVDASPDTSAVRWIMFSTTAATVRPGRPS